RFPKNTLAVSVKLMPASRAQLTIFRASPSLACAPDVMLPRQARETARSVLLRLSRCISFLELEHQTGSGKSAVDVERMPVDEVGFSGGEKDGGIGDLIALRVTPHRNQVVVSLTSGLIVRDGGHLRIDRSGGDFIHCDPVGCEF